MTTESILIRKTKVDEFRQTEEITREAFWNHFQPGADEHYILHNIRESSDYIPDLDLMIEVDNVIVGHIVYSKSKLMSGDTIMNSNLVTFGPVCVLHEYRKRGIGSKLIQYSMEKAQEMNFDAIIIYGDTNLYYRYGFESCEKWNIATATGKFSPALMGFPLKPNVFTNLGSEVRFHESHVFDQVNEEDLEKFDESFPKKEKGFSSTQLDIEVMKSLKG